MKNNPLLAIWGRGRIMSAEVKMPGIMGCRSEFGPIKPLKDAKITVFLEETNENVAVIGTLDALGAVVHRCASISCTSAAASAAAVHDSTSFFERLTHDEYVLSCFEGAIDWGHDGGPDLIIDLSGDASFLIHECVKAEEIYANKTGQLSERDEENRKRLHKIKESLAGVCVMTPTAVKRHLLMQANGTLLYPAISVHDSVIHSKYNMYSSGLDLLVGVTRATNTEISGKRALVCGYGNNAGEGCALALKQAGADVVVYEVDPNHALRARLRCFPIISTLDDAVSEADLFALTMGSNRDHVFNRVKKMKDNAVIYITDPSSNSINAEFEQYFSDMKLFSVDDQTDKWVSSESNKSIMILRNKGYADDHMLSSWSRTSLVVAMLDMYSKRGTGMYENKIYDLPEHLEEKVFALHLCGLGAMTTNKGTKEQADHVPGAIHKLKKLSTIGTDATMSFKKILYMLIQACSIFGIVALGLAKASKVSMELSISAKWGN